MSTISKSLSSLEINQKTYWKFTQLSDGGIHLTRKIKTSTPINLQDITGPFWIFGKLNLTSGTIRYKQDKTWITPDTKTWGFALPPHTVIQALGENVDLKGEMFIYHQKEISMNPTGTEPFLFLIDLDTFNKSFSKNTWLKASNKKSIARVIKPSACVQRAKSILDRTALSTQTLGDLGRKLKTNPAFLSREFKKYYGVSMVEYRTWIRVMVASQALLREKAIIDVFQDVGFQDLGRFYKQFKKVTSVPPGSYKIKKSKNAKK